ncbi:hypothetical protein F2Q69_00012134 [Brassica cretica]|uniref:Uncharacterized protein n=1 Tax=Brassica cretica TaxID=69181 RepID=A0A8S9R7W4_BRACR|nr:hypothetical protein F2Q69_00012134 [Brassica cretica]
MSHQPRAPELGKQVAAVEPEKILELADVEPDVTSEGTSGLEPADVEPDDHAEPELVGPAACESADPAAPEPEDHAESADPAELQPSVWEPPEQLLRQPPGQLAGLPSRILNHLSQSILINRRSRLLRNCRLDMLILSLSSNSSGLSTNNSLPGRHLKEKRKS